MTDEALETRLADLEQSIVERVTRDRELELRRLGNTLREEARELRRDLEKAIASTNRVLADRTNHLV